QGRIGLRQEGRRDAKLEWHEAGDPGVGSGSASGARWAPRVASWEPRRGPVNSNVGDPARRSAGMVDDATDTRRGGSRAGADAGHDEPELPTHVGRYRVTAMLGRGGMGIVYAAHDDALDRPIAVKVLRLDAGQGSGGRQRLLREAQALAKLSHPNIVHV